MTRRELIALAAAPVLRGETKLDRSRLSVLTDEVGPTLPKAIAFVKQYGLSWVEVRLEPGKGFYESLPAADLEEARRQLSDNGIGISFLNSTLLKFTVPGTTAVAKEDYYEKIYAREGLTPEKMYHDRNEKLRRALDAAHALGVTQLRSFTFWRVAEPRSLYPRLAEILGEMAGMAQKAGCRILIESETATNTATSAEVAELLRMLPPSIGINWDPQNSLPLEPDVFPAGYNKLPKERIGNVQMKAAGLLGPKGKLDWNAIVHTMAHDGYAGKFGLETHTLKGDDVNVRASHQCVREMVRIVGG